jgi:hypothetical protein
MTKDFLYRVILKDGSVHENLTYSETFDMMAGHPWDVVQFMEKDSTLATVMGDD